MRSRPSRARPGAPRGGPRSAVRAAFAAFGALAFALPGARAASAQALGLDAIARALGGVHQFQQVAVAPDGRRFADVSLDESGGTIALAEVARPAATTHGTACPGRRCDEEDLAWSPDGRRIVFVTSDATGQGQIAVWDVAARGARVLTRAKGPLSTPRWSPDGSRIAFLYSPGAPKTPSPLNPATPEAGVVGSVVYEQRLAVIPAGGGELRLLGRSDANVYEYDWSPDGTRFAVTAARGDGDANWWIADLETIDARTGAARALHRPALQIASPRWSGDGKRIAYIGGLMSDEGITGGDVYVVPAAGGAATDVTPNLKASVSTIAWNGSPDHILATELLSGHTVIATLDVRTKRQQQLWSGEATPASRSRATGAWRRRSGSRSPSRPRSCSGRSARCTRSRRRTRTSCTSP